MTKRYKVTVTEVREVKSSKSTWERVDASPTSKYAYTPPIETVETVEVDAYEQEVETLDLTAVICAVNQINVPNTISITPFPVPHMSCSDEERGR